MPLKPDSYEDKALYGQGPSRWVIEILVGPLRFCADELYQAIEPLRDGPVCPREPVDGTQRRRSWQLRALNLAVCS